MVILRFFASSGGWIAVFYGALTGINREVLESWLGNVCTVADVLDADRTARARARAVVDRLTADGPMMRGRGAS